MRIRIVDAFTDRPFAGNPAGVVLLDAAASRRGPGPSRGGAGPDSPGGDDTGSRGPGPGTARTRPSRPADHWMQQLASEVNLSETAFAHPLPDDPEADWALRWFTPTKEVRLCGHATLATAHVLYETGAATGAIRFATLSGVLAVTRGEDGALTMDFPAAPVHAAPEPEGLARALGAAPLAVYGTGPLGDLLVEFADEKSVLALRPDLGAVARLEHRGVIVTAPAARAGGYQFVSRFFAPRSGVPEDPVTGSAHTALAPLWSRRLGRRELVGFQASARGGLVATAVDGDRVRLTGRAVTVIDGEVLTRP